MNHKLPEIRIRYGWLFSENVSEHLNELWGGGTPLRTYEEYEKIADDYRKAWQPYEKKILRGMCETFGLTFRQGIIDVYIAPWVAAFSDPMVIGVTNTPDRFVEILTHELLHRLLTDNNESTYHTKYAYHWKKLFGVDVTDEGFGVLVHIPVHAGLQAIFDDVLGEPERTAHDKELCKQWPTYDTAWKYVEEHGYRKIIEQLQENYRALPATA